MVRLADLPEASRKAIMSAECPAPEADAWTTAPDPRRARVAIISTAGLLRRGDRPFSFDADDYRVIPAATASSDILMSHISTNYDRTGFQQDHNIAFPLDRLKEMAADGEIGSVAGYHYSFMGATHPKSMEAAARTLAGLLKSDGVDTAILLPV
jgi:D-proline reductase (dithiol) PrdB